MTLVEDTMRRFKGECAHFSFNKCPIYTDDGASAKFSTNSHEKNYSVPYTGTFSQGNEETQENCHDYQYMAVCEYNLIKV